MTDIAPNLLERLQVAFEKNLSAEASGKILLERIRSGKGTYEDAGNYADVLGKALADALAEISPEDLPDGQMYWNIADRVLRPLLESDYDLAAQAARMVQDGLNQAAKIGIKAQAAHIPQGRVDGILNTVCSGPFEDARWILGEPLQTFCRAAVDDTLQANLDFQRKAGLGPRIIRRTSGRKCCEICSRLAGTYHYPEDTWRMEPSVFWRHNSCRCVVEYDPDGSGLRQNVHTKKWTTAEERAILEKKKTVGLSEQYPRKKYPINHETQERYIDHPVVFFNKQKGKKFGKHCVDFGLDPSSEEDRTRLENIVQDIVKNADERFYGVWYAWETPVLFHIKGEDVVIESKDGQFITVMRGGTASERVKSQRKQ